MEKGYDEEHQNIVIQKCVLFNIEEDEENEYFIIDSIDINDMYNQN